MSSEGSYAEQQAIRIPWSNRMRLVSSADGLVNGNIPMRNRSFGGITNSSMDSLLYNSRGAFEDETFHQICESILAKDFCAIEQVADGCPPDSLQSLAEHIASLCGEAEIQEELRRFCIENVISGSDSPETFASHISDKHNIYPLIGWILVATEEVEKWIQSCIDPLINIITSEPAASNINTEEGASKAIESVELLIKSLRENSSKAPKYLKRGVIIQWDLMESKWGERGTSLSLACLVVFLCESWKNYLNRVEGINNDQTFQLLETLSLFEDAVVRRQSWRQPSIQDYIPNKYQDIIDWCSEFVGDSKDSSAGKSSKLGSPKLIIERQKFIKFAASIHHSAPHNSIVEENIANSEDATELNKLMEDAKWSPLKKQYGNARLSTIKEKKTVISLRSTFRLRCTLLEAIEYVRLSSSSPLYDKNLLKQSRRRLNENSYGVQCTKTFPWPMTNRWWSFTETEIVEPDGTVYLIKKRKYDAIPKGNVEMDTLLSGMKFKIDQQDSSFIDVTAVERIDFGGNLPSYMIKSEKEKMKERMSSITRETQFQEKIMMMKGSIIERRGSAKPFA
eukprot:TRINITY_DN172_c0_g1_i1.p1 TRINITY_DN172_c0_g1~~TRINITY_DN172_c0_g1_i1.p1  ORF type:complete len:623 (+),score=141.58 TRINITY_DN172_c0_g1_i1:172-1869(+)